MANNILIRINNKIGQYEHYIPENDYWSPGIIGDDRVKSESPYIDNIIRNNNNELLSYTMESRFIYPQYSLPINRQYVQNSQFIKIIDIEFNEL